MADLRSAVQVPSRVVHGTQVECDILSTCLLLSLAEVGPGCPSTPRVLNFSSDIERPVFPGSNESKHSVITRLRNDQGVCDCLPLMTTVFCTIRSCRTTECYYTTIN
jgi:hypothetical protein